MNSIAISTTEAARHLGELMSAVARLPRDLTFADDLEKVNEADQPAANPGA